MPSQSLIRWRSERSAALDEIEAAHLSIGGTGRGRRYATQQINQAYAVLLSSHFQGFCRNLHSESADHLTRGVTPSQLADVCRSALVQARKLDQGNPNPGNLGADFNRFGLQFWDEVRGLDARNRSRLTRLIELNNWRNAIAHQDFLPSKLGSATLHLKMVKRWRGACLGLANAFDEVMRRHIELVVGASPW